MVMRELNRLSITEQKGEGSDREKSVPTSVDHLGGHLGAHLLHHFLCMRMYVCMLAHEYVHVHIQVYTLACMCM